MTSQTVKFFSALCLAVATQYRIHFVRAQSLYAQHVAENRFAMTFNACW